MSNDTPSSGSHTLRITLSAAALVALTACIIIPVNYHDVGVRHNVSEKTSAKLQAGITTKRDIFLLLGEPDFVSEDEDRIGYAWTKVKMIILWASYGGGGGEEVKRSYILEISFENDLVRDARIIKDWGPQVVPTHELKKEKSDVR